MTAHASLSVVAFDASVTLPTLSHFVRPSNIFSRCFLLQRFPSIILVIPRSFSFSLLITWSKKISLYFGILIMSDLVVAAFCNTVSLDFFAVHEIHNFLRRNHMTDASSFFYTCLEIVQASHSNIKIGSNEPFFLCESRCGHLLVLNSFSENPFFACPILDTISVLLRPSLILQYPSI